MLFSVLIVAYGLIFPQVIMLFSVLIVAYGLIFHLLLKKEVSFDCREVIQCLVVDGVVWCVGLYCTRDGILCEHL